MKSPEKFRAAYSSGIRSSPVPYDAGDNFMGSFRTTLNERLNGLERVDETSTSFIKGMTIIQKALLGSTTISPPDDIQRRI